MLNSADLLEFLEVDRPGLKGLADRLGLRARVHRQQRAVTILDAVRISCAHSLRGLGLPLADACRLASTVSRKDWERTIAADGARWLCLRRDPSKTAKWVTAIATSRAEVDELIRANPAGLSIVHLGPMVSPASWPRRSRAPRPSSGSSPSHVDLSCSATVCPAARSQA